MADLPRGWAVRQSSSTGRTYYVNEFTKATQWEKPDPVGQAEVERRMNIDILVFRNNNNLCLFCFYMERGVCT